MPARFSGLAPWESDSQIIECVSDEFGVIDLHNSSSLREVEFRLRDGPALSLVFEAEAGFSFTLTFNGVRDLVFRQTETDHWPPNTADVETFDAVDYFDDELGRPQFKIGTLFGDIEFRATEVVLAQVGGPHH